MTFHEPMGYLGAGADYSSLSPAEARREAVRVATGIYNAYRRILPQARPLMRDTEWSDAAFIEGSRLVRRMSSQRITIPIPTQAYGALIKQSVAQLGVAAIQAKRMAYSEDPAFWLPSLVRMHRAQNRMADAVDRMGSEVRPQNATGGLGFWPLGIAVAAFVIVSWAVVDSFFGASQELTEVGTYVSGQCDQWVRRNGAPCPRDARDQFVAEALAVQDAASVPRRVMAMAERGQENASNAGQGLLDKLGTAGIVAIGVGGVVLTGMVAWAVWPYLATVRGTGRRIQQRAGA